MSKCIRVTRKSLLKSMSTNPNAVWAAVHLIHIILVHGGWSNWGGWSGCSVQCGGGSRSRSRSCTNPSPQYEGNNCAGSSDESGDCNIHPCPSGSLVFFKFWFWNLVGSQIWDTQKVQLDHGVNLFSVDGGWSTWSPWAGCSVSCGDGTWSRSRSCTNPSPQHGGNSCTGSATEDTNCNDIPCPSGYFYLYLTSCCDPLELVRNQTIAYTPYL